MIWENSTETCILPYVKQIASPDSMHETSDQGWCTGMTQRDGMGREVGVGIKMGNTGTSMSDSCQCMAKPTAAAAKVTSSCPTLCDPIDGSPAGSSVHGILQARTLEWVAISFSKAWKWKVKVKSLSRVWLFVTPWTAAYQAPPSTGFPRQEYWSGLPLPSLAKPTAIL